MKHLFFALLLFSALAGSAQTGGTYLPAVTTSAPINPIAQTANWMKNDTVVSVWGTVFLNGMAPAGVKVRLHISVPFPTSFAPPAMVFGTGQVTQSVGAPVPAIVQTDFSSVVILFTPTYAGNGNVYYNFSYIKREQ